MAGLAQICHSAEISHLNVTEGRTLLPSLGLNSAAAAGAATEAEGQTTRHPRTLTADPRWHFFQSPAHICVNIPWHSDTSGSHAYQHREYKHQSKPRGSRWIQVIILIVPLFIHSFT